MVVPTVGAVIAAALVVTAAPAAAHDEHALHALTVIERVYPVIDGIEVRVVHLDAPALVVTNETDEALTVLGEKGEPFLQIGPRGVRANAKSPTTYVSAAPWRDTVPPGVKANAKPQWVTFSAEPTWTWFDRRLRVEPNRTSWQVPLMLGGQPIAIEGRFESLHGHGHFVTEIEVPEVGGLDIRMTQGPIPALFVRNDTGDVLSVPGHAGEPFLRIGPRGVIANLRSPTYYTSGATSILEVPASADASARPRWKKVSPNPVWGWLERRAAVPAELHQRAELGDDRRTVLEWTSRFQLGGQPVEVRGHVDWIPPRAPAVTLSQPATSWWVVGLSLAALAALGVFLTRRSPRPAS